MGSSYPARRAVIAGSGAPALLVPLALLLLGSAPGQPTLGLLFGDQRVDLQVLASGREGLLPLVEEWRAPAAGTRHAPPATVGVGDEVGGLHVVFFVAGHAST